MRQIGMNPGLHVLDMTGPDGPRRIARHVGIRGHPRAATSRRLYVSNDAPGVPASSLTSYDITDPHQPRELATLSGVTDLWPAYSASRAYMRFEQEARPIELAGSTMRLGSGRVSLPGGCSRPGATGTRLWTARSSVTVFDMEDIDAPRQLANLPLPASAYGVAPQGDRAFVADGLAGLVVVELVARVFPTATATMAPSPTITTPTATLGPPSSYSLTLPLLYSTGGLLAGAGSPRH